MIARELETIARRQQQLEATNERLQEKAVDIRRNLKDLDLTESQYLELRLVNEDDLALKDFVAVCLFNCV
jgi:progesterone-induced-blocking factor 1